MRDYSKIGFEGIKERTNTELTNIKQKQEIEKVEQNKIKYEENNYESYIL